MTVQNYPRECNAGTYIPIFQWSVDGVCIRALRGSVRNGS